MNDYPLNLGYYFGQSVCNDTWTSKGIKNQILLLSAFSKRIYFLVWLESPFSVSQRDVDCGHSSSLYIWVHKARLSISIMKMIVLPLFGLCACLACLRLKHCHPSIHHFNFVVLNIVASTTTVVDSSFFDVSLKQNNYLFCDLSSLGLFSGTRYVKIFFSIYTS